jgi:Effector-associated domain 11/CHAT domain
MTKAEIQQLIANGRMKEALKVLGQILPSHQQNTVILLQGRFNGLESKEGMGIISGSEANIERNRITAAVLELLVDLPGVVGGRNTDMASNQQEALAGDISRSTSSSAKTILFAAANPSDQARLQTDVELRTIKEEMQKGGKREAFRFLPVQFAVRITELLRSFKDNPTIIHFAGHGEEGGIIISTNGNEGQLLNDATIQRLFKPLKGITELVLLNNCYSARQAQLISNFDIFVIGHNIPVEDAAAQSFSKGFYLGLSEGMSYEDAFNDGITALLAENQDYAGGIEVWRGGKKLEW